MVSVRPGNGAPTLAANDFRKELTSAMFPPLGSQKRADCDFRAGCLFLNCAKTPRSNRGGPGGGVMELTANRTNCNFN